MTFTLAAVLGLWLPAAPLDGKKPVPKFPMSKATTYITEPLDKDGYLDYETALNERLRGQITPETNAMVLLWQAIGPKPDGKAMPADYFQCLGTKSPPTDGEYFVDYDTFVKKEKAAYDPKQIEQEEYARSRPWMADDFPLIAKWLEVNEKPLEIVVRASRRADSYNPLVYRPGDGKPAMLMGAYPQYMSKVRSICIALCMRAMLKTAEKKYDEAWSDLIASHRLSRHISQGTLIATIIGISMELHTVNAELTFFVSVAHDSKTIEKYRSEIDKLPSFQSMADEIDLAERFIVLDAMQHLRRLAPEIKNDEIRGQFDDAYWNETLRMMNGQYDFAVKAIRNSSRKLRVAEFEKRNSAIGMSKGITRIVDLALAFDSPEQLASVGPKKIRELADYLVPTFEKRPDASDRIEQHRRNLQLAVALASYRADNGKYPKTLDELAPKYLAKIPNDLFTEKPLTYQPNESGYLLYSFGQNEKDDNGKTYGDLPYGCDDIRVRVPLPKMKRE